jgi:hypothetical protein
MNLSFKGGVGKLLHYIGYFLVFGFTATCTYMLFASITPPGLWWIPILALGFIEYGALKWKRYHKEVAEGTWQHVTSLFLLLVCIVAIVGTTTLEVTKWFAGAGYLTTMPWIVMLTVYYLIGTIGLNVLAYMTIDLIHPDHVAKLQALGPASLPSSGQTRVVESQPARQTALPTNHQPQAALPAAREEKERTFTMAELRQATSQAYDEGHQHAKQSQASPLQSAPLTTGNQEGSKNGKQ